MFSRILCFLLLMVTLNIISLNIALIILPESPENFCPARSYPFMVGIMRNKDNSDHVDITCGGTLVHPRVVLTAASCIEGGEGLKAVVGLWLSKPAIINVAGVRLHPGWLNQEQKIKDNVGVMFLADEVYGVKLLRLPKRRFMGGIRSSCEYGQILSMGEVDLSGTKVNVYSQGFSCGKLRLIDEDQCYKAFPFLGKDFPTSVICTYNSVKEKQIGLFRSDAGSPLICGSYQIGIASFSIRYRVPLPNVFTRIDYYSKWIRSKIPKIPKEQRPHNHREDSSNDEANRQCESKEHKNIRHFENPDESEEQQISDEENEENGKEHEEYYEIPDEGVEEETDGEENQDSEKQEEQEEQEAAKELQEEEEESTTDIAEESDGSDEEENNHSDENVKGSEEENETQEGPENISNEKTQEAPNIDGEEISLATVTTD